MSDLTYRPGKLMESTVNSFPLFFFPNFVNIKFRAIWVYKVNRFPMLIPLQLEFDLMPNFTGT